MEQEHKLQKKAAYPAQVTVFLRLAAGGYLLYLAYGLIPDILAATGERRIIQAVFVLLFAAVGSFLLGWSAKKLVKGEFIRPGQLPDEEESPLHLRVAERDDSEEQEEQEYEI